jgi:predicted nucleic acid-binding protein
MIRVVLDTNIVISALRQPQGLPARTFLIALAGTTAQLCASGDVYAEYEEVIRRPKFNRSEAIIDNWNYEAIERSAATGTCGGNATDP